MMQAQQNACSGQTLSNKVRILIREKENRPDLSGAEVLNQVYVKSGCTLTTDGNRVCLSQNLYFLEKNMHNLG